MDAYTQLCISLSLGWDYYYGRWACQGSDVGGPLMLAQDPPAFPSMVSWKLRE